MPLLDVEWFVLEKRNIVLPRKNIEKKNSPEDRESPPGEEHRQRFNPRVQFCKHFKIEKNVKCERVVRSNNSNKIFLGCTQRKANVDLQALKSKVDFFFDTETESTQLKTPSLEKTNALSPTLQGPENHAAHHVTQECHHPRPPLRAFPEATSRTLWQLHRTGLLAIWISKPAAPFDAECEARGVS